MHSVDEVRLLLLSYILRRNVRWRYAGQLGRAIVMNGEVLSGATAIIYMK